MKSYAFNGGVSEETNWLKLLPPETQEINESNLLLFFETMFERQEVWWKRNIEQASKPWTTNKILRDYKYTNVYRELDRSSQWQIKNIFMDETNSMEDLVWKILVYRIVNNPDTFKSGIVELPKYRDFDAEKMATQFTEYRKKYGNPFHSAYLMNLAWTQKPKDWDESKSKFKDAAYCKIAFPQYHSKVPEIIQAMQGDVASLIQTLQTLLSVGLFNSHEFFVDFTYITKYSSKFTFKFDEDDYTAALPGSSLGLRLIFPSLEPREQVKGIYFLRDISEEFLSDLGDFKYIEPAIYDSNLEYKRCQPNISLHQIEMWLCEFSKYWKMFNKVGKQRSKYAPKS